MAYCDTLRCALKTCATKWCLQFLNTAHRIKKRVFVKNPERGGTKAESESQVLGLGLEQCGKRATGSENTVGS
ncbi:unnamed protein product [Tenebrio molitor]|nr:unnamed protein product [Tenebrio molitor]